MDIKESLNKLFALHTFGVKLGLENITNFLHHIDDPQKKLKAIHIAGSNGKGSTASFIASILIEKGYKVGLYTSPHFVKFNERIMINGKFIPDEFVADFVDKHSNWIDEHQLTFFEVTTAMAFEYFMMEEVDFAVIETGLGGRLDATNVIVPLACVITSISLEHTNVLGNKLEEIAFEKGEIIKGGTKTFTGFIPEPAIKVIEKKCLNVKSQLYCLEEYVSEKNDKVDLYTEEIEFDDWNVPLKGKYQKYNAALAALTVVKTFDIDDPSVITNGIKNVVKNTHLQGRYETVQTDPKIILDSAHNPEGIKSFIEEFSTERHNYKKSLLLFGVMKDKNIEEMLFLLKGNFDEIFFTEVSNERSASLEQLEKYAVKNDISFSRIDNIKEFLESYRLGEKDNCLVITGSMYLLGDVKSILS
ncbi:MAG: folylpolyglutamate synthase/dihydrofolate synthase family protein [Ignavibacteriaceae bacterium]